MDTLCQTLQEWAPTLEESGPRPASQRELRGRFGVFAWFLPRSPGGQRWSDAEVIRRYLRLTAACLTTTLVITQRMGAFRNIAFADNPWVREQCPAPLTEGRRVTTMAIFQLTTSRRHLTHPVLEAGVCELAGIQQPS